MLRLPLAILAAAAVLAAAATSAPAAERFAGVTERGALVGFTSQNPYALTRPRVVRGLLPGERLVALGRSARGVVAVGTSARLYALDLASARATPIGAPFAQGLRGARFSLAVAPGSDRARLLSDVGQDLVVDLATGATTDGPALRRERDGATVRPAADMTPDGSIVGVQLNPDVLLRELARGTTTMAELPFAGPRGVPLDEPAAFQLGEDGRGYVAAVVTDRLRERQSVLLTIDPSTGRSAGPAGRSVQFFGRRMTTFAALGATAADRTPPRLRLRVPRTISARGLVAGRLPISAHSNEAAQATVVLRAGGQRVGFTFETRDTPGAFRFSHLLLNARERGRLRRAVGRSLRLTIGINDLKGNHRTVVRTARLTR